MRITGRVKWFDVSRDLGVIGRTRDETDCFVRHAAIRGTVLNALAGGDVVEFDVVADEAGLAAQDLIRLGAFGVRAS